MTKYYYAGNQCIAMRKNGTLTFMVSASSTQRLGNHLGSTSIVTDVNVTVLNQIRYKMLDHK
jgi:hypothetical protein